MMSPARPIRTAVLLASALACACAFAHGDGHAQAATPPVKEQKPWGIAGEAGQARTVTLHMGDDMRFRPDRIAVRQGETVRFVVANGGAALHEMVIGTASELQAHA